MAKNSFLEWDTVANNNTDVGGVNIAEGCAPSGINNSIRTMMAQLRSGVDGEMAYSAKSTGYTALLTDNNAYFRFTASATLALTAAATLGSGWHCFVYAYSGDVTIDPNASETINGATTQVVRAGEAMMIICDGTNFYGKLVPSFLFFYTTKSAGYTALYTDLNYTIRFTAAATLALTAAATLGNAWRIRVMNTSTGDVVIDPNASELINGAATLILKPNQTVDIVCDGSAFWADVHADTLSGPQLQGFNTGLTLTTAVGDPTNDITIAAGAAAADTSPFYLMQLASALTKQIDATWAFGNNAGGLDTGSVGNNTYYIWLIQRSDTGVVDALYSLSSTAPTMPTSYDRKRLIGSLIRSGGVNGAPVSAFLTSTIQLGTAVTPTVAAVDKLGIPANTKRIFVDFSSISTNGTSPGMVQIGTSAGMETTNYLGSISNSSPSSVLMSTGFLIEPSTAATASLHGILILTLIGNNTWSASFCGGYSHSAATIFGGGSKVLAGVLDRIRITTVLGTPVFDAGTLNISYEV